MAASMSTPVRAATWQEHLEDRCRDAGMQPPVFQMYSDRRGGRTAWSCRVTIDGKMHSARYWYDGNYIQNAKEDVAEVAYLYLTGAA